MDSVENADRASFYVASSELFNLLDDHVRETTHMSSSEIRSTRCIDSESFARANQSYARTCAQLEPLCERCIDDAALSSDDRETIASSLETLDNSYYASSGLPFPINVDGSVTVRSLLNDSIEMTDTNTNSVIWSSTTQRYARYAYVLARYRSLEPMMSRVESERSVKLFPIILPLGSAWQSGTSQLLWILLHTICALSISRANDHLIRLLIVLKNLSFFIWCGDCAHHWSLNGGNDYFDRLSHLPNVSKLPIDIVVAKCHNTVAIVSNRRLCDWTVARLIEDYREFAERRVLRRRPHVCGRYLHDNATGSAVYPTDDDSTIASGVDAEYVARGEWLLLRLWRRVCRDAPIGCGL